MQRMKLNGLAVLLAFLSLFGCIRAPVSDNGLASLPNGPQLAQQINQYRSDAATPLGEVGFIREAQVASAAQGGPLRVTQIDSSATVAGGYQSLPRPENIRAVYYDGSRPRALLRAHSVQRALFKATGQWTPVLRVTSGSGSARFSFMPREQLYAGFAMAEQLNTWATDVPPGCADGKPSFYCSGVLVRATDYSEDYHSWENSPLSEEFNSVSFNWYRADQNVQYTLRQQGFVMQPLGLHAEYEVKIRCLYAMDAGTGGRDSCVQREPCFPKYDTPEKWIAEYNESWQSCRLPADESGVSFVASVRQHRDFIDNGYEYNEAILAYWPPGVGRALPLYAFFFSTQSHTPDDGRPGARFIQRDFLDTEGEYRPVVGYHPTLEHKPFSYDIEDQSYE